MLEINNPVRELGGGARPIGSAKPNKWLENSILAQFRAAVTNPVSGCRVVENQLLALGLDLGAKAAMGAAWSHLFEFRLVTQRNPSILGRPQRGTLAVLLV